MEPPRPCSCSSGEGWAVLHPIQQHWDVEERAFSSLQVSTACRVRSFWMHGAAEGVGIPAVPVHLPELLASQGKPDFAELSTTKKRAVPVCVLAHGPLIPALLTPASQQCTGALPDTTSIFPQTGFGTLRQNSEAEQETSPSLPASSQPRQQTIPRSGFIGD